MARWFDGEMAAVTRLEARAHLDECEACRLLLVEISRELFPAESHVAAGTSAGLPVLIGSVIGRYHVLEWLGQGGMGVVYGAYDPQLERRVALKLLRSATPDEDPVVADAAARLLTEAKALARVSHPHVVVVHDAGTHGGQVFLVMEHLDGGTLAEWQERAHPTAEALVERYEEAARGLSAAHEAGFVHGDVKPSNLMIGSDGRVRVTDFGLAREAAASAPAASDRARSIRGTPAYLAPEQLHGGEADARSDQYSFCVALREALKDRRVPAHVKRALARGLSTEPGERFADMHALLAALRPPPERRRWITALALGALLVGASVAAAGVQARAASRSRELCAGAARQWEGIWGVAERARAAAAFHGSGASYAADTWREAERETSAYVDRWSRAYTETCEATRVRGEQPEQRMNERMACLGDARDAVRVVTGMFAIPSPATVEDPLRELSTLPDVESCERPPPVTPDATARAAELEVRRALDEATAEDAGGEYAKAAAREEALAEPAAATASPRLQAEVAYAHGVSLSHLGQGARSVDELYRAVAFAEDAREDVLKARALTYLGFALSSNLSLPDEAAHVQQLAASLLKRLPGEIVSRARALQLASFLADGRQSYAEATAASEQSLALLEAAYGPDDFRLSAPLENVGRALEYEGKLPEARDRILRAAAILEKTVGTLHPLYAQAEYALALIDVGLNQPAAARTAAERALAIYLSTRPESAERAAVEEVLAQLSLDERRFADALEHARIAARFTAALSPRDDVRATALEQVGEALVKLSRYEEAIALDQQVVDECAHQACDVNVEANGLLALGEVLEEAGRPVQAIGPLTRAVTLRATAGAWPAKAAAAQFALGRVLLESHRDPARAHELVEQALTIFRAHPESRDDARHVETWLAAHAD